LQDLEATIWLEHYLCSESRTLVVTSHDTAFLSAVVEETIILRKQQLRYFEGTPAAFEVNEKKEFLRATRDQAALDKKRMHVSRPTIATGIPP
jgi:ATP-binding cassette subfamily F protein 3